MKPICLTHDRGDLRTYMFVLQLRVNKRKISMHVGQQRGSTEGDLVDPYVFTRSVQSISFLHEGTSHFQVSFNSFGGANLLETKCVAGKATGMRTLIKEQEKKSMINNWWRWSLLSEMVTGGRLRSGVTPSPEDLALSLLVYEQLLSRLAQAFVVCGAVLCCGVGGGGVSTPSAFLYATMTVLSRAVSPHQQPSILIAQPKSQSKLATTSSPQPDESENATTSKDTGTNYHQVASKVPLGCYV